MTERLDPKPKTRLEQLQEVIQNAPQGIEAEFERTPNDWLSCFGSKIFVIETFLQSPKVQELIGEHKYRIATIKL